MRKTLVVFLLAVAGCRAASAQSGPQIVVNECSSGPSGWIELVNTGT